MFPLRKWDTISEIDGGNFGFGKSLDHVPPILKPGILKTMWGTGVNILAQQLGLTLDRLEEFYELCPAPETFDIPATRIEKGTSAGVRFEVRGIINEKPVVVVQHVTRQRPDDAPHWPKGPIGRGGGYRIEIKGQPDWIVEIGSPGVDDPTIPGTMATALRVVNAIPAVCAARLGLLTPFDLPVFGGCGLVEIPA